MDNPGFTYKDDEIEDDSTQARGLFGKLKDSLSKKENIESGKEFEMPDISKLSNSFIKQVGTINNTISRINERLVKMKED